MNCRKIRELIDDAERPDMLSIGVVRHTADCSSCQAFADERLKLRELLTSTGRVFAPPNFDAQLRAKLYERAARRRPWWLSRAAYVQFSSAAAVALALFVFVQYSGTTVQPPVDTAGNSSQTELTKTVTRPAAAGVGLPVGETVKNASEQTSGVTTGLHIDREPRAARRRAPAIDTEEVGEGAAVLWLRNDDLEVGMPAVTVGAQRDYYMNALQQGSRTVRTSF